MKKPFLIALIVITVFSCAPVLRREIMETAIKDATISDIRNNPDLYRGKPFILGGLIVNTRFIERGSLIEAVYVPVDSRGYLEDMELSNGRFLAIFPKEKGLLDPLIYRRGREITLAGEFIEIRLGRIDEMDYTYPVFEIKEIYLWKERKVYYPDYPLWGYPYHYWWDPWWWRHYPPYWW